MGYTAEDMRRVAAPAPAPAVTVGDEKVAMRDRLRRLALAEAMSGQTPRRAYSPIVLSGLVRLLEFCVVLITGVLAHHFYIGSTIPTAYLVAEPAVAFVALVTFQALGLNKTTAYRNPVPAGFRLVCGWTAILLVALALVFFLRLELVFSRVWIVAWYISGLAVLLGGRVVLSLIVRRMTSSGQLDRRTVIVGGGSAGESVLRELGSQRHTDLRICGVFDDRTDERSPDVVAGYPRLGTVDDLVEFARHTRIDLVIFTLPITAEERLLQMLRKLWVLPIDIRLAAHTNKLRFRPRSYSWIGNVPVLDVFDKPITDWSVVIKTLFDKIVGGLLLLTLSPIMLLVALAVKLDSRGPVFFRQIRHGFNNEEVPVLKFRSMFADQLDHQAERQVTRNDPRVTRVGRFIRRTSLDELPQLINVVFSGTLSLVGPRPHAILARAAERRYDEVVDGYFARHRVRPGLTGWAQIHGWRGETDTPEKIQKRVECDLYYIENWSIFLDIYILFMTPFALLKAENAY